MTMFFVSNSLADTLLRTLGDYLYGKKDIVPIVLMHQSTFVYLTKGAKVVEESRYSFSMALNEDDPSGKSWRINGKEVTIARSYDVPADKVYIFSEYDVTTVTYQKQDT